MDGGKSGCSAETTDPSTTLRFGRDDKGRAAAYLKSRDWDVWSSAAGTPRSLHFGRDDKERVVAFRKGGNLDGRRQERLLRKDCRSLHYASLGLRLT
jgi:hypothetical protein